MRIEQPFCCAVGRALVFACGRFLPAGCSDYTPVLLDEDGAVRDDSATKKEFARRLDFGPWLLAWDRYALGTWDGLHCVSIIVIALVDRSSSFGSNELQRRNEA